MKSQPSKGSNTARGYLKKTGVTRMQVPVRGTPQTPKRSASIKRKSK